MVQWVVVVVVFTLIGSYVAGSMGDLHLVGSSIRSCRREKRGWRPREDSDRRSAAWKIAWS